MSDAAEGVPENAQDLTIFVQNLLEQMVGRIHMLLLQYDLKTLLRFIYFI